jgi:MFS superfamily sulfate permease-like transporter
VTGIVAGVVASVFGGSSVQVSGPTGDTAVVLVPIAANDLFLDFGERTNVVLDNISV